MSAKKKSASPISTPSANSKTPKTRAMLPKHDPPMMEFKNVEVVSRPSSSPLAEVYRTQAFKNEWANQVRFNVAMNLLHLRRYSKMSQSQVGKAVGTSQSAIARIESGQENITLDTLERLVTAMNGRFHVSIPPQEFGHPMTPPWWEQKDFYSAWTLRGFEMREVDQAQQVILGLERNIITANTMESAAAFLVPAQTTAINQET